MFKAAFSQNPTLKAVCFVLALAALLNISPLLFTHVGGDIDFQFTMIDCFAGQFWQGDIYPRWCFSANGDLGAPLFILYFPLPFYVASIFYPLLHIPGVTIECIYIMSVALATFIGALGCYLWLREIVTPQRALLAAILFLFIPYRSEVMLYRSAYSELWCLAFLPFVFHYTRRIAKGEGGLMQLAISFTLALLCHVPVTVVAIIGSGLYLLITTGKELKAKLHYAGALLWALALSAFYWLPAMHYKQFMSTEGKIESGANSLRIWSNDFLSLEHAVAWKQQGLLIIIALAVVTLATLSAFALSRRKHLHGFLAREAIAWTAISAVALFLLLPISRPFYALLGPLADLVFPWRMQALFVLALAFFAAVWMQHFLSHKQHKTGRSDYIIVLALLVLISHFLQSQRTLEESDYGYQVARINTITMSEYRSKWTDKEQFTRKAIVDHYRKDKKRAEIIRGKGKLLIAAFGWDGIVLESSAKEPIEVRINHQYFPVWTAHTKDGAAVELKPEPHTGRIIAIIPAGQQLVTLQYRVQNDWGKLLSSAALLYIIIAALCVRRRILAQKSF